MPDEKKLEPPASKPATPATPPAKVATTPSASTSTSSLPGAPVSALPLKDPEAGKTFKKVDSGKTVPIAAEARRPGPGRPRKIPDARGPAKAGSASGATADRPGTPAPGPKLNSEKTAIAAPAPIEMSTAAARTLVQTAAYIVGGIESLLCKIDLADGLRIWKLSSTELDVAQGPASKVIAKHMPDAAAAWADEIELTAILAPIFMSRLYMLLAAKNPEVLERILAAATGQGASPDKKESAQPAGRPQAVPSTRREPGRSDQAPAAPANGDGGDAAFVTGAADPEFLQP